MNDKLRTQGFCIGSIILPEFQVQLGEKIGIVISQPFNQDWYELIQCLNGIKIIEGLLISATTIKNHLLSTNLRSNDFQYFSVTEYLRQNKIDIPANDELLQLFGIGLDSELDELPATSRLGLDLYIIQHSNVDLFSLSLAGLDPSGLRRIGDFYNKYLTNRSVISLLSSASYELHKSLGFHSRYIHSS